MIRAVQALVLMCAAVVGSAAMADDVDDPAALYEFLQGRYTLIGKTLDSAQTFVGTVVLVARDDHLEVRRDVGGESLVGTGHVEHVLGPDQAPVLRVRFTRDHERLEATYLWMSDLDNYARLTGYFYRAGEHTDSPGMEALFIEHAPTPGAAAQRR